MPGWLQGLLGVAGLAVIVSQIIARWGGRAARQDIDGRTVEKTVDTVHQHAVVDATLSSTISGIARGVERMEQRLDRLAEGHAEIRETSVRHETERTGDRDRITRVEADMSSLRAEVRRVDEAQSGARHALRAELHGLTPLVDIADAIKAQSAASTKAAEAMAEAVRLLSAREVGRASARAPRGG